MNIKQLKSRTHFENKNLNKLYPKFDSLINELRLHSLKENVINFMNQQIDTINYTHEEKELLKEIRKSQQAIIKMIEKEHKIVPKNYYRNLWMILGMAAFGLPIGVASGVSLGNIALLGIGMPIGMVIGMAIGTKKDKEAENSGKQLNFSMQS